MTESTSFGSEALQDIQTLKEAVVKLSRRVEALEKSGDVRSESSSAPAFAAPLPSVAPPPPPPSYAPSSTPAKPPAFSSWLTEDWPMKVGAFLFLLGMVWFVTYAFMNNWVGPMGRIAIGVLVGVGILAFGFFRMRAVVNQGGVLLGLGTTIILLTIFAARTAYDFFTPLSALGMMTLTVFFTAYASVVYRSQSVALMSLVSGAIAPFLVGSPDANFVGLFSYLFFLCLGTLWIVRLTGWRMLTVVALFLNIFYSLPFILEMSSVARSEALSFAFLFAALFFVSGLLGVLKDRLMKQEDVAVVAMNGLLLLGWIYTFVPDSLQSFVTLVVAVIFSGASYVLFRVTGIALPAYLYSGNAVLFFFAATAFELSGATLTMTLALETGLLVSGTLLLMRSWEAAKRLSWLMIIPIALSLENLDRYASVFRYIGYGSDTSVIPVFTKDFFAILTLAVVSFGIGILFHIAESKKSEKERFSYGVFLLLTTLYVLFLVWYGLHRAIDDGDTATLLTLILYTLSGIALYVRGGTVGHSESRVLGGGIMMLVTVRLLFVDVWNMGIVGRIITFLTIGILFLVTAFLGRAKKTSLAVPSAKIATLFLGASVCFIFPSALSAAENESVSDTLSAFESVRKIGSIPLSVPTVVEVPLSDFDQILGARALVFEETNHSFQPSLFRTEMSDIRPVSIRAIFAGEESRDASFLLDQNFKTSTDFLVRDSGENTAEIRFIFDRPETLSGFMLDLDRYVALPTRAEIRRVQNGNEKIVLASSRVSDQTLRFPRETGTEWTLRLSYVQPLRIAEILPIRDGISTAGSSIRFLARPGEVYAIYSNPDRMVSYAVGEPSNLSIDKDVLRIAESPTLSNTLYKMADVDEDGAPDRYDNCVRMKNSDQKDENANGLGDVCDDYDKDSVANSVDNCQNYPNRDQLDADGDGSGDACDREESRFTERYTFIPWVALIISAVVVGGLLVSTLRRQQK